MNSISRERPATIPSYSFSSSSSDPKTAWPQIAEEDSPGFGEPGGATYDPGLEEPGLAKVGGPGLGKPG